MGMSVRRIEERKRLPWPRYRVAWWGEISLCWHEDPKIHTDYVAALRVADAYAALGHKVRVCVLAAPGKATDYPYDEFVKLPHAPLPLAPEYLVGYTTQAQEQRKLCVPASTPTAARRTAQRMLNRQCGRGKYTITDIAEVKER